MAHGDVFHYQRARALASHHVIENDNWMSKYCSIQENLNGTVKRPASRKTPTTLNRVSTWAILIFQIPICVQERMNKRFWEYIFVYLHANWWSLEGEVCNGAEDRTLGLNEPSALYRRLVLMSDNSEYIQCWTLKDNRIAIIHKYIVQLSRCLTRSST